MRQTLAGAVLIGTLVAATSWGAPSAAEAPLVQLAQAVPLRCGASTQQMLDDLNHGVRLTADATAAREGGRPLDAVTFLREALPLFPLPRCAEPRALALYELGLAYYEMPTMGAEAALALFDQIDQVEAGRVAGVQMPNADLLITNALNVLGGLAARDGNVGTASERYDRIAAYSLTDGQRALIRANHATALFVTYFDDMGSTVPPAPAIAGMQRAFCLYQEAVIGFEANRGAPELLQGAQFDDAVANFRTNIGIIHNLLGADPAC